MNNYNKLIFVFFIMITFSSLADIRVPSILLKTQNLPYIQQEHQHTIISERIFSRFMNFHYRKFNLDKNFSIKIFDRYLNLLDYHHNLFLQSQIEKFSNEKIKIGEQLKTGQLNTLYMIFNLAQQKSYEHFQYILSRINIPINFIKNDIIEVDRSRAPWPKTNKELNQLWDVKLKFDWLNLKLSDKNDKEIKLILTKRYNFALKRLTQIQSEDVFQLIMNAFAQEIDPHTNYLSPNNTERFNSEISLSLNGIGAVLKQEEEYIIISSMVTDGPAEKSKLLKIGDKIIGVGKTNKLIRNVVGCRLDDVVTMIKGPKGSKIYLEVISNSKFSKPNIVTLIREHIRFKDRAVKFIIKSIGNKKVAVLNIPNFYIGLTNDVKIQLQKILKNHINALVIDLRGNGGGVLSEAVSLSGLFIPSGPIVQVRDNSGKIHQGIDDDDIVYYKGPLTILINRLSASASEIFSAAMQDYGRALIVGESSFGKGTVQQYHSLSRVYDQVLHPNWPALGSIQYSIQKFYRITGDSIQCKGVTPDIIMPTNINLIEIGESSKKNALHWDNIVPTNYNVVGNINQYITNLTFNYKKRIAKNLEFKYLNEDIIRYHDAIKLNKNIISLNYIKREQENKKNDVIKLRRINERFAKQGKIQLKTIDNLFKNYELSTPYLDETIRIAIDLANF
ncbi:MAG: carboxy terminal-processing peptidase [Arsenophonus sp. ET-YP4-MAG3]